MFIDAAVMALVPLLLAVSLPGCQQIIRVLEIAPPIQFGPAERIGAPIVIPTTEGSH